MTLATATRLTALTALLFLAGCGLRGGYWAERINELPNAQAYQCLRFLDNADAANIRIFCPRGMPIPRHAS